MNIHIKRLLINGVLFLTVAGLSGWMVWHSRLPADTNEKLFAFGKGDVEQIIATHLNKEGKPETLKLQKAKGDVWQVLEPKQMPANPTRIKQLLTLLDERVEASYNASGKNLQSYGLSPEKVTISVNGDKVVLGETNLVSNRRYVLHNDKISMVSEAVYDLLTGPAYDFLQATLIPQGHSIKLITFPPGYEHKAEGLKQWAEMEASHVKSLSDNSQNYGQVILTLDDNSQVVLDILTERGEIQLANKSLGLLYVFPESARTTLLTKRP